MKFVLGAAFLVSFASVVACGVTFVGTAVLDPASDAGPQKERESSRPEDDGGWDDDPTDADADGAVEPPTPIREDDAGVLSTDASIDASLYRDASTAEYTITTNGTYTINSNKAACSGSGPSAKVDFRNDGASSYRMLWLDVNCTEKDYGVVGPGSKQTHSTFVNHRWRLRRTSDNRLIVDFTLQTASDFTVTVH